MKNLLDKVSIQTSRYTTRVYSTSFSMGIQLFAREFRDPIYAIYGFVRFADEIVDSLHEFDKKELLDDFIRETWDAIDKKVSLNPILNSFQWVVNTYGVDHENIHAFLHSMQMDLNQKNYTELSFNEYVLGSAEVVGLMCLRVFCFNRPDLYEKLKHQAMKLGSAYQKINFLRDLKADYQSMGRSYFPEVDLSRFDNQSKRKIEQMIELEFKQGLEGIKQLPRGARAGVYLSYVYFYALLIKIRKTDAATIMNQRIRIADGVKLWLLAKTYFKVKLSIIN